MPAFGAFPGANGKIVFFSNRDPGGGILTMDADGSNVLTLTQGSGPEWSPDGSRIAFISSADGDNEVYVMNADGTGITQLTHNPVDDQYVTWSPDGTKVLFGSGLTGPYQIYMMDANPSGTPTPLTNSAGSNAAPAWSPDGTKIAFTSTRDDGNLEIYVMDADGGNQTRLTNDIEWDYDPIWAPDGSRIAFSHGGNLPDIYVMNADGTGPVNLTPSPASADYSAAWSPDGTKIAFITDRDGNAEIYVMNADGSNPTNISNTLAAEGHPDWQPIPQPPTDVRHDVELLAEHVSQLGLPMGIARSLVAKLNEVLAAIDADDTTAACVSLSDFTDKVRAQSGKKIAASDAADLIEAANAIADELGCDGCYPDLPAPQLVLESTTVLGEMVEFQLDVPNYADFPDDLFEPAPDLAPCGLNTSASRTWVDVLDGNGNYLYGFCSLGRASDLNNIWFATPVAQWPAEAYIRLTDRRCNITYTSNRINLAEIL